MTFWEFNEKFGKTVDQAMPRLKTAFWLLLFALLVSSVYEELDRDGKVKHSSRLDMKMTGNWIDNESRNCSADMIYDTSSHLYVAQDMRCPNDVEATESHNVPIAFWGLVARGRVPIPYWNGTAWAGGTLWRCVRSSDQFTCYAIN